MEKINGENSHTADPIIPRRLLALNSMTVMNAHIVAPPIGVNVQSRLIYYVYNYNYI